MMPNSVARCGKRHARLAHDHVYQRKWLIDAMIEVVEWILATP